MGVYLNSKRMHALYQSELAKPYFVDKSRMIQELVPFVQQGNSYLCITRPRRFGKTVMANMLGAFFSKGKRSGDLFCQLEIADTEEYGKHLNCHDVIYIPWNELPKNCTNYTQYIDRIQKRLLRDLSVAYPSYNFPEDEAVWDVLDDIYEQEDDVKFIFIFDEWDFIFHRDFVTDNDRKAYLTFLSSLLKDKPYVSLAYLTGILPIAKYSSGSELNMFLEYTMASEELFSRYFGFTESEVDCLFEKYCQQNSQPKVTRGGLKTWYDGYHTFSGERIYNPRSVVASLTNNNLGNYWTSSGPYDEIFYYIKNNIADVREDLAVMVAGESVPSDVREYAATSMNLQTKDEIFSAMVVYGFLSYENGTVAIPNKELMDQFADMVQKESSLGYIHRLARESDRMIKATLAGDTATMETVLSYAHDTETPLLAYNNNNETELSAVVNLVYLSARNTYHVEREDKSGVGYVDFIFYPKKRSQDCIILELKVDHTPEDAIQQIIDRRYALRFHGKLGEKSVYTGRILAVGIGYDKKDKKHHCKVQTLSE